jgi:hypothetical protein
MELKLNNLLNYNLWFTMWQQMIYEQVETFNEVAKVGEKN